MQFSFKNKIYLTLSVMFLVILLVGGMGVISIKKQAQIIRDMNDQISSADWIAQANGFKSEIMQSFWAAYANYTKNDFEKTETYRQDVNLSSANFSSSLERYKDELDRTTAKVRMSEKDHYYNLSENWKNVLPQINHLLSLLEKAEVEKSEIEKLVLQLSDQFLTTSDYFSDVMGTLRQNGNLQNIEAKKINQIIMRSYLVVCICTIIIIFVIAYLFGYSIISPIIKISKTLIQSSNEVNNASEELNVASEQLFLSSSRQSSATHNSVAAVQQITNMINKTAEFSNKTKIISDTVQNMSSEGDKIMKNMVNSMAAINKENDNIREIVNIIKNISQKLTVINDIVFKTQLLSFNASIEAARAGHYGKGFAVVAEEVGKLATMSGNAAKEIFNLLENSQKKVNDAVKSTETTVKNGQEVTNKAQAIFDKIAINISLINEQISEIAQATNEQGRGVQQTESALKQLDNSAQENNDVAIKAKSNSLQLQKSKDELNLIVKLLNQIILGKSQA